MAIVLILIFAFCLRALFFFHPGSDQSIHLWLIRRAKRNGFRDKTSRDSLIPGVMGYPCLWHYLCGFMPQRFGTTGIYLAIDLLDCAGIVGMWLLAEYFFGLYHVNWSGDFPLTPAQCVAVTYAFMPIYLPIQARITGMGSRVFGNLLGVAFLVAMGFAITDNSLLWYGVCFVLNVLVILSSQFASQTAVFFTIGLSLAYLTPFPILVVVSGFLLGLLVPPLGVREVFRQRINHSWWYARVQKRVPFFANRNRLSLLASLPIDLFLRPKRAFHLLIHNCSFFIAAYSAVPLCVLLYWLFAGQLPLHALWANPWSRYLVSIIGVSIVVFLLTSFRWLLFLGEAERYFEYSGWAICILMIWVMAVQGVSGGVFLAVLAIELIGVMVNLCYRIIPLMKRMTVEAPALMEMVSFLTGNKSERVISIPTKLAYRIGNYAPPDTMQFYFNFIMSPTANDGFRYMMEQEVQYDFIRPDFRFFQERYGITTLVCEKIELDFAKGIGVEYGLDDKEPIFENDRFVVYSMSSLVD